MIENEQDLTKNVCSPSLANLDGASINRLVPSPNHRMYVCGDENNRRNVELARWVKRAHIVSWFALVVLYRSMVCMRVYVRARRYRSAFLDIFSPIFFTCLTSLRLAWLSVLSLNYSTRGVSGYTGTTLAYYRCCEEVEEYEGNAGQIAGRLCRGLTAKLRRVCIHQYYPWKALLRGASAPPMTGGTGQPRAWSDGLASL